MSEIDRTGYRGAIAELENFAGQIPNTRLTAVGKVTALAMLNMRWERVMVDRGLSEHPFGLVEGFIADARRQLAAWQDGQFIEAESAEPFGPPAAMEERHHDLFQTLWVNFSPDDYRDRIARYDHRLRINGLADGFLQGAVCIDFGCGHGNFAHALRNAGASRVLGIDYGEESIRYALAARDRLGVDAGEIDFRVESIYECSEPDATYDFALQNGVFHHLDDEDAAYRQAHRVLKPGGWMWIYTDGADAVSHDLWDASVRMLAEIPAPFVLEVLDFLNVETNKRYHLGDGLNATYRHTSYADFTQRLEGYGFGEFRRLTGGFPTDFDHDVIEADPYGREKFGEGDIRVLARKVA